MTLNPRPSRKVELKLKARKVQRKVRVPSRRRGKALNFLDNVGMGRNHRRAPISNTSIIVAILLFCRMRTWFPCTLIHETSSNCEYEAHYFPLNCLLFLFALTFIPTYVYRVLFEAINCWERWFPDLVEPCWYRKVRSGSSPLRLREYARNRRPWMPVNENENLIYRVR